MSTVYVNLPIDGGLRLTVREAQALMHLANVHSYLPEDEFLISPKEVRAAASGADKLRIAIEGARYQDRNGRALDTLMQRARREPHNKNLRAYLSSFGVEV